jgi:hypothetical protein
MPVGLPEAVQLLCGWGAVVYWASGRPLQPCLLRYESFSGSHAEAKSLISEEIADNPSIKEHALQDDDLAGIHDLIKTL